MTVDDSDGTLSSTINVFDSRCRIRVAVQRDSGRRRNDNVCCFRIQYADAVASNGVIGWELTARPDPTVPGRVRARIVPVFFSEGNNELAGS